MNKNKIIGVLALLAILASALYIYNVNANPAADLASSSAGVYNIKNVVKGGTNTMADFEFNKDGNNIKFSNFVKNKVVLLNFWGTWCPPCRREIPDIIQINKEIGGDKFVVIGMAMEKAANPLTQVGDFSQKQGINYVNFISTPEIINAFGGIDAVPTTFIIDKNGKIAEKIVGGRSKADFMAAIKRVLK